MHRYIITAIASLLLCTAGAQGGDDFAKAYRSYEAGALDSARVFIDRAAEDPTQQRDAGVWLLRGFVYKDLHKNDPAPPKGDRMRQEALNSLYNCLQLDTGGLYARDARQAYEYLGKTYYNDAARALNDADADRAVAMFKAFKEAMLRLDPQVELRPKEIEFSNALGTVQTKTYNLDRNNEGLFDRAIATYSYVLKLDPENYGANYNLATLYYNHGVYNIQRITPENDIPSIEEIQAASKEFFGKALPYMLKAFDMNPKRKETLLGLEGIYYSLQDTEKSDHFRALYEALIKEEGDEK